MSSKEKLAQLIRENPGATIMIDNDNWQIYRPGPVDYDTWSEDAQMQWDETHSVLAANNNYPELSALYGYGVLEALAIIAGVKIEQV